jgi:hypothetical protein
MSPPLFLCHVRQSPADTMRHLRLAFGEDPPQSESSDKASAKSYSERLRDAQEKAKAVRARHPRMQVSRLIPMLWTAE